MEKGPNQDFNEVSLPEEYLNLDDPQRYIKDDSPDTPKKRRTQWLNRNKQYLLGFLALALVVGSLLYTLVLQTGPDYIVALATSYSMPEAGRKQLEGLLSAYADDRNGDGRVRVQVQAFAFVPGTTDKAQRADAFQDLEVALLTGECMLFLHDDASFEEAGEALDGVFQYNDGSPMPAGARDFKNASIPWTDCKALTSFQPDPERLNLWDPQVFLGLCENLRVSLRAPSEAIKADGEVMAYYEANAAFMKRLQSGEKAG